MMRSYRNRGQLYGECQMSFRWMAFMTASRRLWVRSFWLM